jgi:anti-sigma B factor antagonist
MALLISTKAVGPALVFELQGSLDAAQAEKFEAKVNEALDAGHKLLVFDLARLTFLSSMGITVFLKAYRRLEGKGSVRFAALQEDIRHVLDVTGLTLRVEIYPTVEDALVGPRPE